MHNYLNSPVEMSHRHHLSGVKNAPEMSRLNRTVGSCFVVEYHDIPSSAQCFSKIEIDYEDLLPARGTGVQISRRSNLVHKTSVPSYSTIDFVRKAVEV